MADLFINDFRGIRKVNPVVDVISSGVISAVTCRNVELYYTENGENVGIRMSKGNKAVSTAPHEIIGQFESVQGGVSYWFIYCVDSSQGYIYRYNALIDEYVLMKDGLKPIKKCNGITIAQGFNDWFVFTNGVDDYVAINMQQTAESERVKELNAFDAENRDIRGLGLEIQDGRLVTCSGNRIHWSAQGNIFDWSSSNPDIVTSPAYQEFDREVTAIVYYNNALVAFTNDYSVTFQGNPGDASNFTRTGATGGGCPAYRAVVKFDNKLFYYDDKAKNVFAYYLIDTGQTRPTNGLANNVIDFFNDIYHDRINEIEVLSYVYGNRSEIWFKLPFLTENKILIYDYIKGEWTERKGQDDIRALSLIGSALYSACGNKILKEYVSTTFDGKFIPCEYKMNIINVGSDSNLKVPKMPLIMTLDFDFQNDFYIEFIYDDKPERSKIKRVVKFTTGYLLWSKDENDSGGGKWALNADDAEGGIWVSSEKNTVMFNLAGLLNFKQLQMRIFTTNYPQEFGIKRLELKRVKTKTKTIG